MKRSISYILSIFFLIFLAACQKDYVVENTSTVNMSGQWWAQHLVNGEDIYGAGMVEIQTYNTAKNDGKEMWITDDGNFWNYKVKCPIDYKNLTFSGENLINAVAGYDITISIKNGKIMKNAAHSTSGTVVDSIYYEIEFSDDDPVRTYQVSGIGYTGWEDDNY